VELLRIGVIHSNGRFSNQCEGLPENIAANLINSRGNSRFQLSKNGKVTLTQKDVREVQLAKGALSAGITLLLK